MDEISLENSLRIIGKSELSHENSGEVPRAANFRSKIRGVETIGVAKMRRNIAENSFQRIFVEKPRKARKFVEIRVHYFCTILYLSKLTKKTRFLVSQIQLLTVYVDEGPEFLLIYFFYFFFQSFNVNAFIT